MRQRDIFWFWLPLFASWLLMTAEGPLIAAAINRLPDEVIMLAAMGIVNSLAVTIESPIINLLATSTALVRDHASYLLVRRFTLHLCLILTAVAILVGYTPLFDALVPGLLDVPDEIARWVRPGLLVASSNWTWPLALRRADTQAVAMRPSGPSTRTLTRFFRCPCPDSPSSRASRLTAGSAALPRTPYWARWPLISLKSICISRPFQVVSRRSWAGVPRRHPPWHEPEPR